MIFYYMRQILESVLFFDEAESVFVRHVYHANADVGPRLSLGHVCPVGLVQLQIYHGDRDSERFVHEAKFEIPASEELVDPLAVCDSTFINNIVVVIVSGVSLDKGFHEPHKFLNA